MQTMICSLAVWVVKVSCLPLRTQKGGKPGFLLTYSTYISTYNINQIYYCPSEVILVNWNSALITLRLITAFQNFLKLNQKKIWS